MSRIKSLERYFYAMDYEKEIKSKLTRKQFAVYTYLLSISKWDAQSKEDHYYVYRNSFTIKEAISLLGITAPTWRNSIEKLEILGFIDEMSNKKGWYIYFPKEFAPLNVEVLSFLLNFSGVINNSGNLVGIYASLYRYWNSCQLNNKDCTITITTLLHLFETQNTAANQYYYRLALAIFESTGLMNIKHNIKRFQGQQYIEFEILFANNSLNTSQKLAYSGPDAYKEVAEAIQNSLEQE